MFGPYTLFERETMRLWQAASLVTALLTAGCASATSTMLESSDPTACSKTVEGQGVPITLKVATHLRVTITEQQYFEPNPLGVEWNQAKRDLQKAQAAFAAAPKNENSPNTNAPAAPAAGAAAPGGAGSAPGSGVDGPEEEGGQPQQAGDAAPPADTQSTDRQQLEAAVSQAQEALGQIESRIGDKASFAKAIGMRPVTDEANQPIRTYDFSTQVIESEKLVLVDQKRPAAGTLSSRSAISKDYTLREMEGQAEDVSIRQIGYGIASTIATLTGQKRPQSPAALNPNPQKKLNQLADGGNHTQPKEVPSGLAAAPEGLQVQTRVVATRVFDLNDPDLELQISEFLATSLPGSGR